VIKTVRMNDDAKPYGRGAPGQSPMLDIRLKTGAHFALPYAYLTSIEFNGAGEIKLDFTTHHVLIQGGNLSVVYTGLLFQNVEFVQESAPPASDIRADKPFIDAVEIHER